jgi:hypothetical protein
MFSSFLSPQKRQRGNELIVSIYLLDLAWIQDETDITYVFMFSCGYFLKYFLWWNVLK